jgi:hypothetical protein
MYKNIPIGTKIIALENNVSYANLPYNPQSVTKNAKYAIVDTINSVLLKPL